MAGAPPIGSAAPGSRRTAASSALKSALKSKNRLLTAPPAGRAWIHNWNGCASVSWYLAPTRSRPRIATNALASLAENACKGVSSLVPSAEASMRAAMAAAHSSWRRACRGCSTCL